MAKGVIEMDMANGDNEPVTERKGEYAVIIIVTVTLCALATWCVVIQGLCVLWKIADMNTTLSNAFMHVTDTVIGAVIGWCAKTGAQKMLKKTEIDQPPDKPIPVKETP